MFNINDIVRNSVNNLVQNETETALEQQVLQDIANEQATQEQTQATQEQTQPTQTQPTTIDNRPNNVPKNYVRYKNTITQENETSRGTQKQDVQGSGTKSNTQTISTDYDTDKANAVADAERERYRQLLAPYQQQQREYFKSLTDIYNRLSPDKVTPLKQDERLAGIQALATAIGNLGRAVGKSLGNDKGLGMVTVDDDKKFLNFYNKALSDHDKVRQAEAEEGLRQLNQQIELLRGKNDLDGKVMAQIIDAGEKARDRALNGNKTVTSNNDYTNTEKTTKNTNSTINKNAQSDTWIDPNSLTTKKDNATISSARSRSSRNSSYSSSRGGSGDTYIIGNIAYRKGGNPKSNADGKDHSKGWITSAKGEFSENWIHFMAQPTIEVTEDQINKYYRALRPVMEKYGIATGVTNADNPSLSDMRKAIDEVVSATDSSRKDAKDLFTEAFNALKKYNFISEMGL